MKALKNTNQKLIRLPESVLLSLVADKIKDRALFVENIESLKKLLEQVALDI